MAEDKETPQQRFSRLTKGSTPLTPAQRVGFAVREEQQAKVGVRGAEVPGSSGLIQKPPEGTPEQRKWAEMAAQRRGRIVPQTFRTRIEETKTAGPIPAATPPESSRKG